MPVAHKLILLIKVKAGILSFFRNINTISLQTEVTKFLNRYMDNPEGGASVKSHGQLPTLFGTSKNKAEVVNLVSHISNCFQNIPNVFIS